MAIRRAGAQPCTANPVRVVDYIVGYLAGGGVRYIFGVDGPNVEDFYDAAFSRQDITAVLAKHEFSAATMADGYSRGGAGLGVVAATSGGGSLNLIPGLAESYASRVPVLALVGQPASTQDGQGSFQDTSGRNGSLNAEALFSAVSVSCERVLRADDIVSALTRAMMAAHTGGPAVLLLPKDVQQAALGIEGHLGHARYGYRRARRHAADPHPIAHALRQAEGTVTIIAGEQVLRDDASAELEQLRAVLRAQVACVPDAKDAVGPSGFGSSSALGITGVMGHPATVEALAGSAVCLLVGTRLPATASAGLDDALRKVQTLSMGSAAPYLACTHVHTDDLRGSLSLLARELTGPGRPRGLRVPDLMPHSELTAPDCDGPGVHYREAMSALDAALPDGVNIVVDAGNAGAAAVHYLPVRRDGRFMVALGMGGMGYSFGAGIGLAFARRQRTVVIAGDGAFFMHGLELHTAVQYRLPVTFVLFNNNAHGMSVIRRQLFSDNRYSDNRFRPSCLGAGLAAMFPDLPAVDVTDSARLAAAFTRALDTDGPSVVSIECSADEIPPVAPLVAAAKEAAEGQFDVAASA